KLADKLGADQRDVDDPRLVEPKYDPALQGRGRIVEVHDSAPRAADCFEAALDQFRACLGQHLNRDIVGHKPLLDEFADKSKISFGGGGKADLDFLKSEFHQQIEHAPLAIGTHRLDQRLIAVPKVDAAPEWGLIDDPRRPASVGQIDG